MIEISRMSYAVLSQNTILQDVDISIPQGGLWGILGKNGAGKTTLLDLIMGLRQPTKGKIAVFGKNPVRSDRRMFAEVSYLSQDIYLKDSISIKEFFLFHKHFFPRYSDEDERKLIDKFELNYNSQIGSLSTGKQRRVQIIAALASRPKVLLIDEITAVLDPESRTFFFQLLQEINKFFSTTILLATNIVGDLKGQVKNLYFIEEASLTEHDISEIDTLFLKR